MDDDTRLPERRLVEQVYTTWKTMRLNTLYYGQRLNKNRKANLYTDIIVGAGTAGSGGIAGLAIWGTIAGQYGWLILSAIATIIGFWKPYMQFGARIEDYTKLFSGYNKITLELNSIVEDLRTTERIPPTLLEQLKSIKNRYSDLADVMARVEPIQNDKLVAKLERQVINETSKIKLWLP